MCVIVVKKQGQPFPSIDEMRNCWHKNPDGAGYMFAENGTVHIRKGFMTWQDFIEELDETRATYGDSIPYVLHFRITTHGDTKPECCHPFPLSDSLDDLSMVEFDTKTGIAHNGIIPNRHTTADKSDTMDYIANFIYPLSRVCRAWSSNTNARKLIDETLCSKLAVLHSNGNVDLFGNFEHHNGCLYSNSSYKASDYSLFYDYSEFEMFDVCDCCTCFDDCEAYGCICKTQEEAYETFEFDETRFNESVSFSME